MSAKVRQLERGKAKADMVGRRRGAIAVLFWVLPAAATAGGLALAPLLALCGAIGAPWTRPKAIPWVSLLVLAAVAWAALSLAWSSAPRPEQALKIILVALSGLGLAAGAAGLDPSGRSWGRASLLAGVLMLALLLAIEAGFGMPFNRAAQPLAQAGLLERNPGRGVLVLEIFGFAGLAAAQMLRAPLRWIVSALLVAALAGLSTQFHFDANIVAFVVGALAFAVGYVAPKLGPKLVAYGWAAWLLAAPWVMLALSRCIETTAPLLPPSWGMRLGIWQFTAARIAEKPLFGWGLDASRTFPQQQQVGDMTFPGIPLHPHHFSLHIWLEAGVVGALLFAAAIVAAGRAGATFFNGERAPAAAATASFALIGMAWNISYGAWQEWFMALPFIAAAAALSLRRGQGLAA